MVANSTRIAFVAYPSPAPTPNLSKRHLPTKVDGSEPPVCRGKVPLESELAWSPDGTKLAYTKTE